MFRKMLVGTDGSVAARRCSVHAARLASALGCQVVVASVAIGPGGHDPWSTEPMEIPIPEAVAERRARDEVAWFAEQGVEAKSRVLQGRAAEALAKEAMEGGYDLMVVGHRGETDMGIVPRLGSVSEELTRLAPCPMLIVP